METSIIDLHLSSTHHADTRGYRLDHCQMVTWLINNFEQIKSGEVSYEDYKSFGSSLGITTYVEQCFNIFKKKQYV